MGGRGSKAAQHDENERVDGHSAAAEKNGTRPAGSDGGAQLSEPGKFQGLPHNESVASRLNRGMKVSSVVSFGDLSEEVVRPLNTARAALNSVHSRMDLLQVGMAWEGHRQATCVCFRSQLALIIWVECASTSSF